MLLIGLPDHGWNVPVATLLSHIGFQYASALMYPKFGWLGYRESVRFAWTRWDCPAVEALADENPGGKDMKIHFDMGEVVQRCEFLFVLPAAGKFM